jgi:hypothetical protein
MQVFAPKPFITITFVPVQMTGNRSFSRKRCFTAWFSEPFLVSMSSAFGPPRREDRCAGLW